MKILCLDFESVLAPEIWPRLADEIGDDGLRRTTRDVPDLAALMKRRLAILDRLETPFSRIKALVERLAPLPGAAAFLDWARARYQIAIISDSFYPFALPLLARLGYPLFIGHELQIENDRVTGWRIGREKPQAVRAFQEMGFAAVAVGDSFNDIGMLRQADDAVLFAPSAAVKAAHPEFAVAADYQELSAALQKSA